MAKKKKGNAGETAKTERKPKAGFISGLKDETIQGVFMIAFFVLAIFTSLAIWGKAGIVGHYTFAGLSYLLGVGYYLLPLIFIVLGVASIRNFHRHFDGAKLYGSLLFLLSTLGIIEIVSPTSGGFIGKWVAFPFLKLIDVSASLVVLAAIVVVSILVAFNEELDLKSLFRFGDNAETEEDEEYEDVEEEVNIKLSTPIEEEPAPKKKKKEAPEPEPEKQKEEKRPKKDMKVSTGSDEEANFIKTSTKESDKEYTPPPLSLLERDKGKPVVGDVKANANIIKRTLMNFGIDVEMDEVSIGPSVTRYALKPAEGVKLARIVALQNDLALALAAHPLRIEAPIPGKSLVGIEIPNTIKTTVGLGTLFGSEEF